jgi:hypothetical protein
MLLFSSKERKAFMILDNLDAQTSTAILGWNGKGLVGYAVRGGEGTWSCYGQDEMGEARRTYRRAGAAMKWLRRTANARRFESLAAPDELGEVLQESACPGLVADDAMACLSDPTPRTLAYAMFRLEGAPV